MATGGFQVIRVDRQTNKQTNKQTDILITIFHTLAGGKVLTVSQQ